MFAEEAVRLQLCETYKVMQVCWRSFITHRGTYRRPKSCGTLSSEGGCSEMHLLPEILLQRRHSLPTVSSSGCFMLHAQSVKFPVFNAYRKH